MEWSVNLEREWALSAQLTRLYFCFIFLCNHKQINFSKPRILICEVGPVRVFSLDPLRIT